MDIRLIIEKERAKVVPVGLPVRKFTKQIIKQRNVINGCSLEQGPFRREGPSGRAQRNL